MQRPIESAACSHVGRRKNNEDALCVEPALGLYVVADGMGGYEGGEIASRLVVETLSEFFARNAEDAEVTWPEGIDPSASLEENLLRVGVQLADLEVRLRKQGELAQMGSTVAALVLREGRAILAHVGDSRVYRLREGELVQLTRDHSLRNMMERLEGAPLPPERFQHMKHVITRAIGQSGDATPDLATHEARSGDVFLLCTDGLSDVIPESEITHWLQKRPDVAAERLVCAAYRAGGADNITALVVRMP